MYLSQRWGGILLGLALCAPVGAKAPAAPIVPPIHFTQYTLPNGLRVILSRDTTAPVVSLCVTYNVGSWVEPKGHTGFAHLFEHLMFQGSKNIGKGEHVALIMDNGGTMNGNTTTDRTTYFESLPANQLPLELFLEADRMRSLDISQKNLDNQRQVVKEERRMRYDNQPYGRVSEVLSNTAYSSWSYKHTPIGSMADLDAADLSYVRGFFHRWYSPNDAVLALVGDFNEAQARALIAKDYGSIPRGPKVVHPGFNEPKQTAERKVSMKDALAPLQVWVAAYHIPNAMDKDFPALSVLGSILSNGKSSRLYQNLVEKQLATSADGGPGPLRGPSLFVFELAFAPGQNEAAGVTALQKEITRVQSGGVTADEIAKVRVAELRGTIASRRSSLGRAQALSQNAAIFDNPNLVNEDLARIYAVTAADVQRVARKYLVNTNRAVLTVEPGAANPMAALMGGGGGAGK